MRKPCALPDQLSRTMLARVFGPTLPRASALRRLARLGLASTLALATALGGPATAGAQAASAADSGWFDPPVAEGPPEPSQFPPTLAAPAAPLASQTVEDTDPSALTTFRPTLDPYGRWVSDSRYGTVWVPHREAVGEGFEPYVSRGHWALTADDDWIWVSDYPFGWAVFHYGRWVWISGSGWAWVPGRTYANAWVVWRVPTGSYSYVGWAPMPPSWVWVNGGAVTLWYAPPLPYVFCPSSYMFAHHVHRHIVRDRHLVHRIAPHTHVYPTPYRAPARPVARPSVSPATHAAPPASFGAPRGPRIAAAQIPPASIPRARATPPASAARLAGPRRLTDVSESRAAERLSPADVRSGSGSRSRPSEARAPAPVETRARAADAPTLRRNTEVRSPRAERARPVAPDRMREPQRSPAPARFRDAPSAPRDRAPAPSNMKRMKRP